MKNLLPLTLLFLAFGCSQDDAITERTSAYITDNDFNIQVVSWETWGDITNDGVTQNILLDKGTGGTIKFTKANGQVVALNTDAEFANKSVDGLLIFNNYWDNNPKIVNFTVEGEYSIEYNSTKDSQSGRYEVSKTKAYYVKL